MMDSLEQDQDTDQLDYVEDDYQPDIDNYQPQAYQSMPQPMPQNYDPVQGNPFLHLIPQKNNPQPQQTPPVDQQPIQPPVQQTQDASGLPPDQSGNPFLHLIPVNKPPEEKKSGLKKANDYMEYLLDSVGLGAKRALLAPAQFINPFVDAVAGTDLTGSVNALGKGFDQEYANKYPDAGIAGQTLTNVAEGLPSMALGGGALKAATTGAKGLKYLGGLVGGGLVGGAAAAPTIYDPSGELSPLQKTGIGLATGAVAAPLLGLAGKSTKAVGDAVGEVWDVAKKSLAPESSAAKDLLGDIARRDETLSRKAAGERLGLNLSPAEASGSRLAATSEADLGFTTEGARRIEANQDKRTIQEQRMIKSLLDDISPSNGVAAEDVRAAARSSIKNKESVLSDKAKPLYEEAYYVKNTGDGKELIDPSNPVVGGKILRNITPEAMENIKSDSLISDALAAVGKDKIFKKDLSGVPQHTVKYLDYTKKYLDDKIGIAQRKGQKNRVRLLQDSKNKLVDTIDELVPQYKEARQTFGPGAQAVKSLRESGVGKISKMKDTQLKNVSKVIFDRRQTDPKVMAELRDEISAQDPNVWKRIIRNELEGRVASVDTNEGSAFYKAILKNDNDFNNFIEATKGMPNVQQKLKDMREVLPYIFNKQSTKAAKGKQENQMGSFRQSLDAVLGMVKKYAAKDYDRAAIDLVTNGKWDKELAKVAKIKNPEAKARRVENIMETIIGASIPAINKAGQREYQKNS